MSDDDPIEGVDESGDTSGGALPGAVAARLRDPAVWAEPDADLARAIVEAIDAERRGSAGVIGETRSTVGSRRSALTVKRRAGARWSLAAAAAVVLVGAAVVTVMATRGDDGGDERAAGPIAVAGTDLAPEASGSVDLVEDRNGVAIRVQIDSLPAAPDGSYYEGWVRSDRGQRVSIGTFHMRGGDGLVTLWSGVDIDEYPTMSVTLQREGGGADSSGAVYLQADLTP